MSKSNDLTADDFPIELGTTYYFVRGGEIAPCTPTPHLSKRGIFEVLKFGKGRDLRINFLYDNTVHSAMKPREVFRHVSNINRQCVVEGKGFYCKNCHQPIRKRGQSCTGSKYA